MSHNIMYLIYPNPAVAMGPSCFDLGPTSADRAENPGPNLTLNSAET